MKGTATRAREALRGEDFRRLFAIRLLSQFGDGLFQASLVASIVFSPEHQSTAIGLAKATAIIAIPFSVIGPFTGVFIDRWSRRKIVIVAPLLRAAFVWLILFSPAHAAVLFYAGALIVLSINRFFLATAVAVVPRLVPTEDLLMANSLATVGGTVALLAGVFFGGQVVQVLGSAPVIVAAGVLWLLTSLFAARITSSLTPHRLPEVGIRDEMGRISH